MAEMASPEPKKRRTGDDLPSTAATNRFSGKVAIVTGGASGRSQLLLPTCIKSVLCVISLVWAESHIKWYIGSLVLNNGMSWLRS